MFAYVRILCFAAGIHALTSTSTSTPSVTISDISGILLSREEAMQSMSVPRICAAGEIMTPNPLLDPLTHNLTSAQLINGTAQIRIRPSDLIFCAPYVNYTAILGTTDVLSIDSKAADFFSAANRTLQRFDCRDFYPYNSCEPCRQAYARWICGIMFPMKCKGKTEVRKLCKDICYNVVRKCPVELEFNCPTDDKAYGDPAKAPPHPCNALDLAPEISAASRQVVSVVVLLLCTVLLCISWLN
eukprot:TRINITY_DN3905_c0_g1_i1.p1 TRINITY_DN3905_c0_g1~~TRINITY_DN3905_c0_g1_i1.p1  ORF type:complete len:243 (-),score=9.17 TRINITY_DN3905_c0_g1_i1:3-731(-)